MVELGIAAGVGIGFGRALAREFRFGADDVVCGGEANILQVHIAKGEDRQRDGRLLRFFEVGADEPGGNRGGHALAFDIQVGEAELEGGIDLSPAGDEEGSLHKTHFGDDFGGEAESAIALRFEFQIHFLKIGPVLLGRDIAGLERELL
jgi:hypothetical protein